MVEQCEAEFAQRKSGEGCSQADCVKGSRQRTGAAVGREWNAKKRLLERMRERIRAGKGKKKKNKRGIAVKKRRKKIVFSYTLLRGKRVYVDAY